MRTSEQREVSALVLFLTLTLILNNSRIKNLQSSVHFMESFLAKIKSVYVSMGLGQFNSTHLYFMVGTTLGVFLIEMLFTGWDKCALKRVFQFEKTTRTDLT